MSPAARVLSLDAWAEGGDWLGVARSSQAALATHAARALLGCVYVFPGLHKLLESGFAWAASENLKHQLWLKWFQAGGAVPSAIADLAVEVQPPDGAPSVLRLRSGARFGALQASTERPFRRPVWKPSRAS